ncbi:MAG TPA: hypothetical protein VFQ44_11095 [Streptosporangiaceae bacterium]|nr:hypothetical protein [Streptosporangiaceae bacterium]
MVDVKLGKNPARHDPRTFAYAKYRNTMEKPPAQAHWGHGLPFTMLDNDKYGDCVEAGFAHQLQIWGDRAGTPFVPTDAQTVAAYTAITGFNPDDPSTDKGTDILTACGYWKSTGIADHQITAYAAVNPRDRAEVCEAIAWYGGAYIGLALPISAQGQVGKEWTVTTGKDAKAGSWGGHCVPLCGYDANVVWCVTWGALQPMTWEFLTTYCDEAFVMLAQEWMEASGESPSKLAWGQLLADLANL